MSNIYAQSQEISAVTNCGIGYRDEIGHKILQNLEHLDCVEIISERYIRSPQALNELRIIREQVPIIPHGVSLSIASPSLNESHLLLIKQMCNIISPPYYSEHLCLTHSPGIDIGHLAPIQYNEENLEIIIKNVMLVQDYLELPLVLENITYPFVFPYDTLTQAEFFSYLVAETNCGILLDIENLYINSINHEFSLSTFLDNLPCNSITQIHLAGGKNIGTKHIDTHSELISEPVWNLLQEVVIRCANIKTIIIEHDSNFPDNFMDLLNQVSKAKNIVCSARSQTTTFNI